MKIKEIKRDPFYGEVQLVAVMEDGSEEFLFGYDPKQFVIRDNELVGKNRQEAFNVFSDKEREYFKHHDY